MKSEGERKGRGKEVEGGTEEVRKNKEKRKGWGRNEAREGRSRKRRRRK